MEFYRVFCAILWEIGVNHIRARISFLDTFQTVLFPFERPKIDYIEYCRIALTIEAVLHPTIISLTLWTASGILRPPNGLTPIRARMRASFKQ